MEKLCIVMGKGFQATNTLGNMVYNRLAILFFLLVLSGTVLAGNKPQVDAYGQAYSAEEWVKRGSELTDPVEMLECFNIAISMEPEWATPYYYRGQVYEHLGYHRLARRDYTFAIRLNPMIGVMFNLEAIRNYSLLIEMNPEFYGAYLGRGVAWFQLAEFDSALADFNKMIELYPEDQDFYYFRAIVKAEMGNFEDSIEDFTRVVEMSEDPVDALVNRGNCYSDLGQYLRAIEDYSLAIAKSPNDADIYYNRGATYSDMGNLPLAIEDFSTAIEKNYSMVFAYFDRGLAYIELGEMEKGRHDLQVAKQLGYPGAEMVLDSLPARSSDGNDEPIELDQDERFRPMKLQLLPGYVGTGE